MIPRYCFFSFAETAMNKACFSFFCIVALTLSFGIQRGATQTCDFFWSAAGMGGGAVNQDLVVEGDVGVPITLYLYASTENFDYNTICLDVTASRPNIIAFTAAETFEFEIEVNGNPVGSRWDSNSLNAVNPSLIDEWCTTGKTGIQNENIGPIFVDTGYDSTANAFLLGSIQFDVTGTGCVVIGTSKGDGDILDAGVPVDPQFCSVLVRSDCDVILGDANRDGEVNLVDVQSFIDILVMGHYQAESDVNCDDVVDLRDITPFINVLAGG